VKKTTIIIIIIIIIIIFSFQPIAVETLGPINESAVDFLRELGRRISFKF